MTPDAPTPRERPLDSPWFWICLFASVAAVAVVAIGPKFRKREARLESTFQMREHLARRNLEGSVASAADDAEKEIEDAPQREELIKTTGPLVWILLAVAVGAGIMLMRSSPAKTNANPSSQP